MKKTTLNILALVCVAVIVGSFYLLTRPTSTTLPAETFGLPNFTMDRLDKIELTTPEGAILLQKNQDQWHLDDAPVETATLAEFVDTFAQAEATLVARQGRAKEGYGLTTSSYSISLTTSDQTLNLDIGQSGAITDSVYVARPGEDAVYLLTGTALEGLVSEDWKGLVSQSTTTVATSTIP